MPLEESLAQKSLEINSLQQSNSQLLHFCSSILQLTNNQLTQLIVIKPQIDQLKDYLFSIILKSKDSKELEMDAARAISILNKAKYSFSGEDLSGINISGADLSCGIFDGTIFENANLDNVNFKGAWLNNAIFKGASVENISSIFEEEEHVFPDIKFDYVTISPNGQRVALLLERKKIILFDINNGMLSFKKEINIGSFNDTNCYINQIIFSHDSNKVVINYHSHSYQSNSKFVDILDLCTGICARFLITNSINLYSLMFSFNDSKLMFLNEKHTIMSLDINTTKQKVFLDDDSLKEAVNRIYFSPNNKNLILISSTTINLLNIHTHKLTNIYSEGSSFNRNNGQVLVTFSSCEELIAATINEVYSNHKIRAWNIKDPAGSAITFDTLNAQDSGCGFVIAISFSPNSKYLIAIQDCSGDHYLYIWKYNKRQLLLRLKLALQANDLIWDKHNNLVTACNNNVLVWKINVNEVDDSINLQLLSALNQTKLSLHGSNFSQTKSLIADDVELLKRHGAFIEDDNSRQLLFLASAASNSNIQLDEHLDTDLCISNATSLRLLI